MKVLIDIDEEYYELLKYEVLVNKNDYKPFVLIANGTIIDETPQTCEEDFNK